MVDLSRDQAGCLHARLLDAVVGRSGSVYKAWLNAQPQGFIDNIEQAALDPFRGYANAIHDGLPDAVAVLDAFRVVRLGTQVVDEVWRRVQQDSLGRRGHKHDPLYQIRGLLRHGVEHLTQKQQAKISRCVHAGDSTAEVNLTHSRSSGALIRRWLISVYRKVRRWEDHHHPNLPGSISTIPSACADTPSHRRAMRLRMSNRPSTYGPATRARAMKLPHLLVHVPRSVYVRSSQPGHSSRHESIALSPVLPDPSWPMSRY
jgi:Transposase